jgi:hypothetical protein
MGGTNQRIRRCTPAHNAPWGTVLPVSPACALMYAQQQALCAGIWGERFQKPLHLGHSTHPSMTQASSSEWEEYARGTTLLASKLPQVRLCRTLEPDTVKALRGQGAESGLMWGVIRAEAPPFWAASALTACRSVTDV